jgi:uncharacterized lipoprotein YddW (UPF0748 family)
MKAGIWMHTLQDVGTSPSHIKESLKRLKDANFSLLIPCVKNVDGLLDYHSKVGKVRGIFEKWDPLMLVCETAGKLGMKVHPWLCVFPEGENSAVVEENPALRAVDSEGKISSTWMCAMRQEVQDYEYSLSEEIMKNYPVDGVHLDYIRTGFICHCGYCQSAIKQKTGMNLRDISARENGEEYETWMRWREDRITEFVDRVSGKAKELGKEVSAAVFRDYPGCVESQGQNWKDWADKKMVDYIIPMTYTNNLIMLREYTRTHRSIAGNNVSLWEGIGRRSSMSHLSHQQLENQIRALREMDVEGVVIFSYKGLEKNDFEIFKKYFTQD